MSETTGIHVIGIEVSNLHRIRVANVQLLPGGRLVKVTGKNGAGKTSLLRGLRAGFGGAGEVLPAAVNDDAEDAKGFVRLELDNGYTITRRFTEANPKGYLTVVGPDGGEHKQGRLNEWLGDRHDFDLLSLFDLRPERQREILLGLGDDPELDVQIDALQVRYQTLYDERTPHIAEQRRARAVSKPEGERPEPIEISAELARMGELQAQERRRQDAAKAVGVAAAKIAQNEIDQVNAQATIERLEKELADANTVALRLAQAAEALATEDAEAREAFTAIDDPADTIAAVHARMREADTINASIEPWREWERAQESFQSATDRIAALTHQMETVKDSERRLIADAGIPVPGLTFDPETGSPLLNGRPLEVASGGERIRMAVEVAIAVNPDLRVCLVDEANDLDLEALEELERLAAQHGFQIFACRIGLEGPGEILVEDGEARSAEPALTAHG